MSSPANILLVRLSSVGDILLATPVAGRLKELYPRARLTWLVDAGYQDLVRLHPQVDRVAVFDAHGRHRGTAGIAALAGELAPVDLLVDLQHKVRSVLLAHYLKPGRKLVLSKRRGTDMVRAILGRDPILRGAHQALRNLALLIQEPGAAAVGPVGSSGPPPRPMLEVSPEDQAEARRLLVGPGNGPWIGLFPGARHRTKRWPTRHLAALADRCCKAGLRVAVLGGDDEEMLVEAVLLLMKFGPALPLIGGSLGLLAGLIRQCALVVSPDSGPAHMAAALGVPVAVMFGPTSPERWAPLSQDCRVVRVDLPCSPCSNHGTETCPVGTCECMENLEPEAVFEAICDLLQRRGHQGIR
jgi:heptosyltransferase-2